MQTSGESSSGSDSAWRDSYRIAQMITLPDVTHVCGDHAGQLVHDLAQGVGCPQEYILLPLLSTCAALMGPHSDIRVHAAWSEPPVLWMVIGARAGSRRSSALRQILSPLFAMAEDERLIIKRRQRNKQLRQHASMAESAGVSSDALKVPHICTSSPSMSQLRDLARMSDGCFLHLAERLEEVHRRLGVQPLSVDTHCCSQMQDLYEGLPGDISIFPDSSSRLNSSSSSQTVAASPLVSLNDLPSTPRMVCYNQCGFAEPEYVVNLTVKFPSWLSGRFLVSCPSSENCNPGSRFSATHLDETFGQVSFAGPDVQRKPLKLKEIYRRLAQKHSYCGRRYVFSHGAVLELKRFQEEEWSTILAQLDSDDQGGVVNKCLGHIVRLTGVLKALQDAAEAVHYSENSKSDSGVPEWEHTHPDEDDVEVEIEEDVVSRAVELGKYFLEQKLSMTFMVSTGFFRGSSNSAQNQQNCKQATHGQTHATASQSVAKPQSTAMPVQVTHPTHPVQKETFSGLAMMGLPAGFHLSSPVLGPTGMGQTMPNHQDLIMPAQPQQPTHLQQNLFNSQATNQNSGIQPPIPRGPHIPVTPSSLSQSTSTSSSSDIDISQLPSTWAPSTMEEEMAEYSQNAEFVQMIPAQFVAVHARRVKRLMECFDDGSGVSATTAAQKSISPPVRVAGTNNRHPAWASALFFQKVADLGLGYAEQVRHPTNGRVYWRFKRKSLNELTEKNFQLLDYLRVDMSRYTRIGPTSLPIPGLDSEALSPVSSLIERPGSGGMGIGDDGSNTGSGKSDSSIEMESLIKKEVI